MSFLVATNVVASRPPERGTTGTPHARAKSLVKIGSVVDEMFFFIVIVVVVYTAVVIVVVDPTNLPLKFVFV